MIQRIPLTANPNRTIKILLDGQECTLSLKQKGRRMYVDLAVGDSYVVKGAICLNRVPIVQRANDIFKGNLVFVDIMGNEHPSYDGLGTRFFMVYYTEDETLSQITQMSVENV